MLPALVAESWCSPGLLCIVHGGGDEISALQRVFGGEPKFAGGRRVTTADDLRIIRMVLSGVVNKRLVSQFVAAGAPAVGVSGEDAALIAAQPLGIAEFGYVGQPATINTRLIETLWAAHFLPVVSPVGSHAGDPTGAALNVNGDDAAAAMAVALHADELVLVADVEGVLDEHQQCIAQLDVDDARGLIASGVVVGGMAAKLEAAYAALSGGVPKVRIADLSAFRDHECGTIVTLATVGAQ